MLKNIALVSMLALLGSVASAQTGDSVWAGTWTLNVAKSKLHPPGVTRESVVIPAPGWSTHAVKYTVTGTAGDGSAISEALEGAADGKPYPIMSDGKQGGTSTMHRQSSQHYTATTSFPNGDAESATFVMAPSGKTVTVEVHVTSSTGNYDQTEVYDKQ